MFCYSKEQPFSLLISGKSQQSGEGLSELSCWPQGQPLKCHCRHGWQAMLSLQLFFWTAFTHQDHHSSTLQTRWILPVWLGLAITSAPVYHYIMFHSALSGGLRYSWELLSFYKLKKTTGNSELSPEEIMSFYPLSFLLIKLWVCLRGLKTLITE